MSAMQGCSTTGVRRRAELAVDGEDAVFAAADQHHGLGIEPDDLAADFRADAAAGAGDHHAAPFEQLADVLGVQRDGVAAQEVVDFDVADGDVAVALEAVFQRADDFELQLVVTQASISCRKRRPASVPATTSTSVAW